MPQDDYWSQFQPYQDDYWNQFSPAEEEKPQQSWSDWGIGMGLRTAPAVAGNWLGTALSVPTFGASYPVLSFAGGALGEMAGQAWDDDEPFNWNLVGVEGGLNLIPGGKVGRGLGQAVKYGAKHGALQGALGSAPRHMAREGRIFDEQGPLGLELPSAGQFGADVAAGAGFGGLTGAAIHGVGRGLERIGRPKFDQPYPPSTEITDLGSVNPRLYSGDLGQPPPPRPPSEPPPPPNTGPGAGMQPGPDDITSAHGVVVDEDYIARVAENGYRPIGKTFDGRTIFRRLFEEEGGGFDWDAMKAGGTEVWESLTRRLGREPSVSEMEEESIRIRARVAPLPGEPTGAVAPFEAPQFTNLSNNDLLAGLERLRGQPITQENTRHTTELKNELGRRGRKFPDFTESDVFSDWIDGELREKLGRAPSMGEVLDEIDVLKARYGNNLENLVRGEMISPSPEFDQTSVPPTDIPPPPQGLPDIEHAPMGNEWPPRSGQFRPSVEQGPQVMQEPQIPGTGPMRVGGFEYIPEDRTRPPVPPRGPEQGVLPGVPEGGPEFENPRLPPPPETIPYILDAIKRIRSLDEAKQYYEIWADRLSRVRPDTMGDLQDMNAILDAAEDQVHKLRRLQRVITNARAGVDSLEVTRTPDGMFGVRNRFSNQIIAAFPTEELAKAAVRGGNLQIPHHAIPGLHRPIPPRMGQQDLPMTGEAAGVDQYGIPRNRPWTADETARVQAEASGQPAPTLPEPEAPNATQPELPYKSGRQLLLDIERVQARNAPDIAFRDLLPESLKITPLRQGETWHARVLSLLTRLYRDEGSAIIKGEEGTFDPVEGWRNFKKWSGVGEGYTKPREQAERKHSTFSEILAIPKSATTTGDLSPVGRQGLGMFNTPEYWKALGPAFKSLTSQQKFDRLDRELRSRRLHRKEWDDRTGKWGKSLGEKIGLDLYVPASRPGRRAEAVASAWIETGEFPFLKNIPGFQETYSKTAGRLARSTNRFFVMFMNDLKTNRAEFLLDRSRDMAGKAILNPEGAPMPGVLGGFNPSKLRFGVGQYFPDIDIGFKKKYSLEEGMELDGWNNMKVAKEIADFVNTATGQAPYKFYIVPHRATEINLESAANALANGLYSPGMLFSRIRMLMPATYMMASPFMRKQYMQAAFGAFMGWAAYTTMIKTAVEALGIDAEVSLDYTSADFGKIRIGNTRLDFGGSFLQFAVLTGRFLSGGWTSSSNPNAKFRKFGEGYNPETQSSNIIRFGENKLDPLYKYAWDWLKASEREPFHVGDRTAQLFINLFAQDMWEFGKERPDLLPYVAAPLAFGGGSQIYGRTRDYLGEGESKFIPPEHDWVITGGGPKDWVNNLVYGSKEQQRQKRIQGGAPVY